MLLNLLRGGDITSIIIGICVSAFVVFCIIPIHEFAHALVAYKLGDETARLKGRLTLAPMSHVNWIGALMILLFGFGYAEPVPVNILNVKMKNKKLAMAIIALAGPVSNIIVAFISIFFMFLLLRNGYTDNMIAMAFAVFFKYTAMININLAVFNFIPIPPLDGSRILFAVLLSKYYFSVMKYERYIVIAIMILLFTGVLSRPLAIISNAIFTLLSFPFSLMF